MDQAALQRGNCRSLDCLAHTFLACSCSPALVLPNGNNEKFLLSPDWSASFRLKVLILLCALPWKQISTEATLVDSAVFSAAGSPRHWHSGSLLETFQPCNLCYHLEHGSPAWMRSESAKYGQETSNWQPHHSILPRVEQSVPHPYKAHVYPWPTTWQDASESVFRCCACLEAWLIWVESICNVYQCSVWFSVSFAAWLRMSMVTTLMTKLSLQVAHGLWTVVLVQNVQIILP